MERRANRSVLFLFHLLSYLAGSFPLLLAWRANRTTSLVYAVTWATGAWVIWAIAGLGDVLRGEALPELHYLALSLTGCAGVAVLGARRPGAGPWNFVVAGLLALLLLPLAESSVTGKPLHLDGVRTLFLAATLAVGILNYLPTRLAGAAVLLALGCVAELLLLVAPAHGFSVALRSWPGGPAWPLFLSWLAFGLLYSAPTPASEFDRLWLGFRNRFGFVWSQRLREQFNHSAFHAGWPVILRWQGLRLHPGTTLPGAAVQDEIVTTLQALMKRFAG